MIKKNNILVSIFIISSCMPCHALFDDFFSDAKKQYKKTKRKIAKKAPLPTTLIDKATRKQLQEKIIRDDYPHAHEATQARVSNELSMGEKRVLNARTPRIKKAIANLTGITVTDQTLPRIALCASGGGYRAMFFSLGALAAADQSGLLDCISYMAVLSGSSWGLSSWLMSGQSPTSFLKHIDTRFKKQLYDIRELDQKDFNDSLLRRYAFGKKIGPIDLFGIALAETILGAISNKPQSLLLSDQIPLVETGLYPYPIYTAVDTKHRWVEFTPHEIGGLDIGGFIPSWALDRDFEKGKTTDFAPEPSLGFLLGIWGSAFEISVHELLKHVIQKVKSPLVYQIIQSLHKEIAHPFFRRFGKTRLDPAVLSDWSPTAKERDKIKFIDAGIDVNMPAIPLLRSSRAVDIIIMIDASASGAFATLSRLQKVCQKRGCLLPPIDPAAAAALPCTIFPSTQPHIPTIIVVSLTKNSRYSTTFDPRECVVNSYCKTFNLQYTPEQITELSGLGAFNMMECRNTIVAAIKNVIQQKQKDY